MIEVRMPVQNADVAAVFDEIADLLELQGENPFRVRAYRNAARTLTDLGRDVKTMIERGEDLTELPGIGSDLAEKIRQVVYTGSLPLLESLRKKVPTELAELMKLPGLGPRRVRTLYEDARIRNTQQLLRACREGRVRQLPGFGPKIEANLLKALESRVAGPRRFKLSVAAQYAEGIAKYLRELEGVEAVEVAGSFRRFKETVGDLDIVVTAVSGTPVLDRFVAYDGVREVLAKGTTRATVVLRAGLQVDVRLVRPESYGAALHYFTGSKAHNIAIRRLGQERGLKINEYGVFKNNKRVGGRTEESVFASVGLPFIPPELREDRGEIEAAQQGKLPRLVELKDLRGDLHAHTRATDGRNTLEEMAEAARQWGMEYLAITEHSRRLTVAKGFDPDQVIKHIARIDRLNESLKGITLLKGMEVDILEDGTLDLPDWVLAKLDVVVASVHSAFHLSRAKQTERVLRAMDNRYVTLLGHPTGRLIDEREPYEIDMARVIRGARESGCYLEVNSQPERLDLNDVHCQMARDAGVLVSIDSDAHSTVEFGNLRFGVGQARRGWLEKKDVLNTRSLVDLWKLLRARR